MARFWRRGNEEAVFILTYRYSCVCRSAHAQSCYRARTRPSTCRSCALHGGASGHSDAPQKWRDCSKYEIPPEPRRSGIHPHSQTMVAENVRAEEGIEAKEGEEVTPSILVTLWNRFLCWRDGHTLYLPDLQSRDESGNVKWPCRRCGKVQVASCGLSCNGRIYQ